MSSGSSGSCARAWNKIGFSDKSKSTSTFQQRSLLELKGLKVPATMEKEEAHRLVFVPEKRRHAGLATLKQLRYLKRLGYKDFDIETLSFKEAGSLISKKVGERKFQVVRSFG